MVPGLDHDGMLDRLDLVLARTATWLAEKSRRIRRTPEHDHGTAPLDPPPFP